MNRLLGMFWERRPLRCGFDPAHLQGETLKVPVLAPALTGRA